MKIEEAYFLYLYSEEPSLQEGWVGTFRKSVRGQAEIAAGMTAAIIGLKTLQLAFSKARKVCGSAFMSGEDVPGRKMCVSKQKVKFYKQKLGLLMKAMAECPKAKDPQDCQLKFQQKINNTRINMQISQDDLAASTKEIRENFQQQLDESVLSTIAKGATFGFEFFLLGFLVDKALFIAFRSAQALYSSASRKCGAFEKGDERAVCLSKIRLQALRQKKSLLDKVVQKCDKQKDPQKCKDKVANEIEKNNARTEMEQNNIIIINKRIRLDKMKAALTGR